MPIAGSFLGKTTPNWIRAASLESWAFIATAAICILYNIYRYPLRINDTSTSPTYSDTPLTLQAGKYALLAVVALVLFIGFRRPGSTSDRLLLLFCLWAAARGAFGAWTESDIAVFDALAPFLAGAVIALTLQHRVSGRLTFLVISATVVGHTIANAVQVVLYLTTGRLPALAYGADAIKRFGGLWDDPNSVGLISALFLVYLLAARRAQPYWLAGAAIVNIVLSVSYSAALALAVGLSVVLVARRSRLSLVAIPLFLAAAAAMFMLPVERTPIAGDWLAVKQKSASMRLELTTSLPTPENLIVGDAFPPHAENSVAAIVGAVGIVGLLIFVAWVASTCATIQPDRLWAVPVMAGFFAAALVVPFITVFPIGTVFPLFMVQISGSRKEAIRQNLIPSASSVSA